MTDNPNLTAALAAVQAELPRIAKGETAEVETKTGRKYSYSYADLADVSQVILPLLGKNGLAWITKPTYNAAGKFVLVYKLRHVSNEEETGEYPLPTGTPQEIGSAITYARRYTLCSVTGVAPDSDDDDAAAASQRRGNEWDNARPAQPDPEKVRKTILLNAEKAIAASPLGGLPSLASRATELLRQGAITATDAEDLALQIDARRAELEENRARSLPAEDRTAEPAGPDAMPESERERHPDPEPAEQQPMDAEWPEPARPGGSDPA